MTESTVSYCFCFAVGPSVFVGHPWVFLFTTLTRLSSASFVRNTVVFGQVVDGMDVVRAVEGVGSGSGATRARVVIESSGQL